MSTESARARAAAAAAAAAAASTVEQRGAGAFGAGGDDRRTRLAAAEAATAAAAVTAQQAAAAAQATVAAAAALRQELEQEDAVSAGSRSRTPERRRQSPSPERRRGRSSVPQIGYRDSRAGTPWPMLTKSNYHECSLLMKVKLQARHLWDAVHLGGITYEDASVPLDIAASITNKRTAKLAWDTIALRRVGGDRVRRATLQRLRWEWKGLAFQPGEHVEDFAVRLSSLMEQMKLNGDTDLTEERAIEKLL